MAIVPQKSLFNWDQLDQLDDLQRLKLVLDGLPDEALMRRLEAQRGRGRDDYPVRAMWNSVLAGIIFGHGSIESLRRELRRNAPLRQGCGFDLLQGLGAVPHSWNYTRFLKLLMRHQSQLDALFDTLVKQLAKRLPDLGRHMAVDGKAIESHARPRGKEDPAPSGPETDGRRDTDAVWGVKKPRGVKKDGSPWEKITRWFGYKLHLVVDSTHELPLAYTVTQASASEVVQLRDHLLPKLEKDHAQLLQTCQTFSGDKGYDDTKTITTLDDDHAIHPIIDIRDSWQDGKSTRSVPNHPSVQYDIQGNVECWSPRDGQRYAMAYGGYEKNRKTHKFRCPARHYGQSCKSLDRCPIGSGSGQVRVPLTVDRRIFTSVARPSRTWEKQYRRRTAVERVNSRIDQSFGFERHFIRGKAKMQLRVSLALLVMLAMANGRLAHQQGAAMRSLVRPAA